MPRKQNASENEGRVNPLQEWVSTGFKSLIVCVISMGVFVFSDLNKNFESSFSALNKNIEGLTAQLKSMELQQFNADKRIQAIEVARELSTSGYNKLIADVAEMKQNQVLIQARLQTVSDFVSKKMQ